MNYAHLATTYAEGKFDSTIESPRASLILRPLLKILSHPPNQIRFPLPRTDRPLQQPRLGVDLHIADRIVGILVQDFVPSTYCRFCRVPW